MLAEVWNERFKGILLLIATQWKGRTDSLLQMHEFEK